MRGGGNAKQNCRFGKNGKYLHRKIVHHDEFCYWLRLMYLFLLHSVTGIGIVLQKL
jgi:hypothetical protein